MKKPVCQDCGEVLTEEEISYDVGVCDDCYSNYVWCSICDELLHLEDAYNHRHLFLSRSEEFYGTGGENTASALAEIKESFLLVMQHVGRDIVEALQRTIQNNHMGYDAFHTVTGLVLGPTILFCYLDGEPDPSYKNGYTLLSCGHRFTDDLSKEDEEKMSYGVQWIFGLDNDATKVANEQTLSWIQEYLASENVAV